MTHLQSEHHAWRTKDKRATLVGAVKARHPSLTNPSQDAGVLGERRGPEPSARARVDGIWPWFMCDTIDLTQVTPLDACLRRIPRRALSDDPQRPGFFWNEQ